MSHTSDLQRFWAKVSISDGCWRWTAARHVFGYGKFYLAGKTRDAHRASYELLVGPIPDGMQVLHRCDEPACIRPDHLFLGTQADNMRDMASKRRSAKQRQTHCVNGHPFEGRNLIERSGRRDCRACGLAAAHRYRQRRKEITA